MNKRKQTVSSIITAAIVVIIAQEIIVNAKNEPKLSEPINGEVIVYDKDQIWGNNTTIDLFERNELDNQLIYPGVSGQYDFAVQNKVFSPKECQVIIEDTNEYNIPLKIRIKKDGAYVLGNETEWADSADYDSGVYVLDGQEKSEYYLEWKWDYYISYENDIEDTRLGKNARKEKEPYNVKIQVYADVAPENSDQPSNPPESSNPSEISEPNQQTSDRGDAPITGDHRGIIIPVFMIIMSIIICLCGLKKNKGGDLD